MTRQKQESTRDDTAPNAAPAAASASEPAATAAAADDLPSQLKAALAERDPNRENWLHAQADLENYRKRIQKEMEQERQYRALPLARDLLPGLDNLQRALEAARTSSDLAKLIDGVQMVARQFDDILARHSILPIEAVGKPFDANLHQALQQVPTSDQPPMTVLSEYERGYTLHDRVVRPSTVIVSASPEPAAGAGDASGDAAPGN